MSQSHSDSLKPYVPEYCVQGERIPFYLLWDNSKKIKISINLSDGLTLEEVYNVNSKDLKIENNTHIVNDFEMGGYFGGVLGSKLYENPSVIKSIKFSIYDDSNNRQVYEKNIELFRPDVHVNDQVETITIKGGGKDGRPISDGRITISNQGKGTAIVRINILDDSEIKEGHPEGFEEFKMKFMDDLDNVLVEVGENFPEYKTLIGSVREVAKNPLPTESKKLRQVQTTLDNLEKAFNNNEKFLAEFLRGIAQAYLSNVSIMTDADSFLAFLKSVGANKLIILDAMKILKISPESRILKAELIMTDLAQNEYPPIKLRPITIKTDKEFSVPFYQILNSTKVD